MSLGRSLGYDIYRQYANRERHRATYVRIQQEAAARPGAARVDTPDGVVWMSPIENELYGAMRREGLEPIAQYGIQGYFVDFAFPDVALAVEADGAADHEGERREHDRQRDWHLKKAGWTVQRFHGTTIYHKAGNCAYVVKQEVYSRRAAIARRIQEEERRRQARRDAILRPFRAIVRLLRRGRGPPATPPP